MRNAFSALPSVVATMTKWASTNIGTPLETAFNSVKTWFSKNMQNLANTFTNLPSLIMKIMNALLSDFTNLGNSLAANLVKAFATVGQQIVNAILSGLKNAVKATGSSALSKALSEAIGIAGLAQGGLVTAPTLALIGEAGPEYVIPQSVINKPYGNTIQPLSGGIGTGVGGTSRNVTVYANFQITSASGSTGDLKAAMNQSLQQFQRELVQKLRAGSL